MCGGLGPKLVPGDDEGQLVWIAVGFSVESEPVIGYLAEDDFSLVEPLFLRGMREIAA